MINILLTGTEGPDALGLTLLREATARAHPTAHPTIITAKTPQPKASFANEKTWDTAKTEQTEANAWTVESTPLGTLHRAVLGREEFSTRPWDCVYVGVQPELILGLDVLTHAATCTGMFAALAYQLHALVLCQEIPEGGDAGDRGHYGPAERIIPHFMKTTPATPGMCWCLNIPRTADKGYKNTKTAHYSPRRRPPTEITPRARLEMSDVTATAQGFATITELQLRVNPVLRY